MAGIQIDGTNYKLVLDADADTYLETATDDTIKVYVSGTNQITIKDGAISPVTDNDIDLGTNSLEFKDGYFDGTLHCDVLDLAGTEHTSISSPITALNNATANELVTVGSTTTELDAESGLTYTDGALVIGGTTPSLTIGDAGAEDTKIVFDGNAQDFHIGLDDSADDLVIGLGSSLGTTTHMAFDEAGHVKMPLQSSFFAYPNSTQSNLSTGGHVTIEHNTEYYDINADFNTGTYTFTAPVTGKYFFSMNMTLSQLDDGGTAYEPLLQTSNRSYRFLTLDGRLFDTDGVYSFGHAMVVEMDAADTAHVTFYQAGGTAQVDHNGGGTVSWFAGCLLH